MQKYYKRNNITFNAKKIYLLIMTQITNQSNKPI